MSVVAGRVSAIALKPAHRSPMRVVSEAEAEVDGGLAGAVRPSVKRGVTLLAREQWDAAMRELGADLPWHTRRANLLVEGIELAGQVGRTLRIGTVELEIRGETKPCGLMDELCPGLRKALEPEFRGGVYGQVVRAGRLAVGDAVVILPDPGREDPS